jgi:glutamine synthetase
LKRTAPKFGLACLLHEKPFGASTIGKHLNWSISDDEGHNLLSPGASTHDNMQFSCPARLPGGNRGSPRAAHRQRRQRSPAGGQRGARGHHLIFLGDMLTDISSTMRKAITSGEARHRRHGAAQLPRDAGDRNRTSLARSWEQIEFRAVRPNQSIGTRTSP